MGPNRDTRGLGMVTFLGMATIIFMMTNDHSRDGGRLEDFDHFGEGHLPRDGDHPKNSYHILQIVAVLGIFTILRDGYLILGL